MKRPRSRGLIPVTSSRLKTKHSFISNKWNGENGTLAEFLSTALSYFGVDAKMLDLQDFKTMHVALNLTKTSTPPIVWELISRRIVDVTAAGVSMQIIDNIPWLGLDYNTASVKGLDEGL